MSLFSLREKWLLLSYSVLNSPTVTSVPNVPVIVVIVFFTAQLWGDFTVECHDTPDDCCHKEVLLSFLPDVSWRRQPSSSSTTVRGVRRTHKPVDTHVTDLTSASEPTYWLFILSLKMVVESRKGEEMGFPPLIRRWPQQTCGFVTSLLTVERSKDYFCLNTLNTDFFYVQGQRVD